MNERHDNEIICPYCDEVFIVSWIFDSGDIVVCNECKMKFELQVTQETTFHTYAGCKFNELEHSWEAGLAGIVLTLYTCTKCGEQKYEEVNE